MKTSEDTVNNETEMWGTADGKFIPIEEVTHQHWSNIYWYHLYILNTRGEYFYKRLSKILELSLKFLNNKFKGIILEWEPKYEHEKKWYKDQNTRKIILSKYKAGITDIHQL